jgi:hypothetical protein
MNQPPAPPSKLFIRSEVLAVVEFLTVVENPPKQDKLKQIKRLVSLEPKETVLAVLVKELQRSNKPKELQTIAELLMEVGDIDALQDPLWQVIKNPNATDEIKDAANLILHHLGDETDPDLYLEYLDDPQGLINRETERMLEVSSSNPEALIDFIDFIFSLPAEEQCNLINSLQTDYQPEYLMNLYGPMIWSNPPRLSLEQIIRNLGGTKAKRAALLLEDLALYFAEDQELTKLIRKSVNELKLAGIYKPEAFDAYREELNQPHEMTQTTQVYQCYTTIPDGIGNQGLVFSRKKDNGDIVMMSVAVNDTHGIIDCFGFYQLSETDFSRIIEKFHEESSKFNVPPEYCLQQLLSYERLNVSSRFRIPYEYTCWKVLMDDVAYEPDQSIPQCQEWANEAWQDQTANLYQHPDFSSWFLEREDHPLAAPWLDQAVQEAQKLYLAKVSTSEVMQALDQLGSGMMKELMATDWKLYFISRLANCAYLLHCQQTNTFSTLAATEVVRLLTTHPEEPSLYESGFVRQYGRRCIEEELLRSIQEGRLNKEGTAFAEWVQTLIQGWVP